MSQSSVKDLLLLPFHCDFEECYKIVAKKSLFNLSLRIQEEREERYKRKKGDSGGVYPDVDLPLTRRSSKSDKLMPHVSL